MEIEQFTIIKSLLEEIRDFLHQTLNQLELNLD